MGTGLGITSIYRNIKIVGFNQLLLIGVNTLLSILIARTLGVEGSGLYSISITLPYLCANLLSLGIGQANVYYIASKQISLNKAFKVSLKLWIFLSTFGLSGAYMILKSFGDEWFPRIDLFILELALLAFPLLLIQQFIASLFQGLQKFDIYKKILIVPAFLVLLFSIVLIFFLDKGILGAIQALIFGQLGGALFALLLIIPLITSSKKEDTNYLRKSLLYGYKAHLSNILAFLNYRIDILLVNYFINPYATGLYSTAVKLVEKLWIVSQILSPVLLPKLSELSDENNKRNKLTPLAVRWVTIFTLLASLVLLIVAKQLIIILFGSEFLEASRVISYLLPGVVFLSAARIFSHDFAARGKPELNMYTSMLLVFLNVILNIILIPVYGVIGAAIATSIIYIGNFLIKILLFVKLSKVPLLQVVKPNKLDYEIIMKLVQLTQTKFKR